MGNETFIVIYNICTITSELYLFSILKDFNFPFLCLALHSGRIWVSTTQMHFIICCIATPQVCPSSLCTNSGTIFTLIPLDTLLFNTITIYYLLKLAIFLVEVLLPSALFSSLHYYYLLYNCRLSYLQVSFNQHTTMQHHCPMNQAFDNKENKEKKLYNR